MPRKTKKLKFSPTALKIIGIVALSLIVGCAVIYGVFYFLMESSYFKIKSVRRDASLSFISERDLDGFINKNIFHVDLDSVSRKLAQKYPEASQLKIIKNYPDQISVEAKRRQPFAQLGGNKMVVIIDERGVVLSTTIKPDGGLPVIMGVSAPTNVALGLPLRSSQIDLALRIIRSFSDENTLRSQSVVKMELDNLSRIVMTLGSGLTIIIDEDDVERRMRVLGVILAHEEIDISKVKYIDLRFREPILGKK